MGADHLLCIKCVVGYNLESGSVFWIDRFIQDHWHNDTRPCPSGYFNVSMKELPFNLIIKHRVPSGFISCIEPAPHKGEEDFSNCFDRECLLQHIEYNKKYWTWFRALKYKLELILSVGDWYEDIMVEEPFVVDKNNPKHGWMVAQE